MAEAVTTWRRITMLIVLTATPNADGAKALARKIVGEKLAACVQILPEMTSVYFWEGEVRTEPERLLLIKTVEEKYGELERFILENHGYDVPEIVAIPSEKVSASYLSWLSEYLEILK